MCQRPNVSKETLANAKAQMEALLQGLDQVFGQTVAQSSQASRVDKREAPPMSPERDAPSAPATRTARSQEQPFPGGDASVFQPMPPIDTGQEQMQVTLENPMPPGAMNNW